MRACGILPNTLKSPAIGLGERPEPRSPISAPAMEEYEMPAYYEYLKLDELLSIQNTESDEHDEMLFVIIHQSYELWFKQILHEVTHLQKLLANDELTRAGHTMKRVLTILKMLVSKIDILETMSPLEFLSFRERLESGSGFQSRQFRELEFVLGHKRPDMIGNFPDGSPSRAMLQRRFDEPTLWDSFIRFLRGRDYPVPEALLTRDVTAPIEASPALQRVLIDVYRSDANVASFCERLIDFDEGLQEWRYRHVKMVERTIGTKHGTGGSTGAEYLRSTLLHPIFPDLWAIRTEF